MKLSYEYKLKIYELRKQGETISSLSKRFNVDQSSLKYMIALMDYHGKECVKKGNNRFYPLEVKQEMINMVLKEGYSQRQVALIHALPSMAILSIWLAKYKENGYTIIEKQRGRSQTIHKSNKKPETELERLEEENLRLRAEVAVLKKLREYLKIEKNEQRDLQ